MGPGQPQTIPQVDAQEAKALLEQDDVILLDVREVPEWQQARIPGARHMPMMQVPERALQELDKDATIVVQCHSGQRSDQVARWLAAQGYEDVMNLAGGIQGWAQAGYPIER